MSDFPGLLKDRIESWARGRSRAARIPVLVVLGWILWHHLTDPSYSSIFDGINLVGHEAGHLALSWLGSRFLTVAGGTIFELSIPVLVGAAFVRQGDWFAVTVALFWLGTALIHVGVYAADARAQLLPLVSPTSGDPEHDWTYILMRLGMLRHDGAIGAGFRTAGLAFMVGGVAAGAWILRLMGREDPGEPEAQGPSRARPGPGPSV